MPLWKKFKMINYIKTVSYPIFIYTILLRKTNLEIYSLVIYIKKIYIECFFFKKKEEKIY